MTLTSLAAVLLTGAGYYVAHGALGGITVSQALSAEDPRSNGSGVNILLIGLDSRKDQDGNDLPWSILKQLHAGDSDDGGYNTNTLILVHVGTDNKVVAFSIPRDDWVPFNGVPGYNHIKIKEAYGLTKQYVAQKLIDQGTSYSQKELETKGREAARAATLRAVRSLTGIPIDYFAEINLAGFYDLAQTLGGVDVCLNHAVYDSYSGADFPAGQQRLKASEALAFRPAAPRSGERGSGPYPPAAGIHIVGHAGTPRNGDVHRPEQAAEPDGGGTQGRRAVLWLGRGPNPTIGGAGRR